MNTRDELDQYLSYWDQAQKDFPKEEKEEVPAGSFFGLHSIPEKLETPIEEEDNWRDVFYRSLEIDSGGEEDLITEEKVPKENKKEGFGKKLAKKLGAEVKFNVNPTHFASMGNDSKLRVTPNFTDGKELRALAKLKSMMYDLESELLGMDVRGGNTKALKTKLDKIRKQCDKLSQRLIPDPKTDVS